MVVVEEGTRVELHKVVGEGIQVVVEEGIRVVVGGGIGIVGEGEHIRVVGGEGHIEVVVVVQRQ